MYPLLFVSWLVLVGTSLIRATVPVALGRLIVLSAVGSITCSTVSKLSTVDPSNCMLGTVIC